MRLKRNFKTDPERGIYLDDENASSNDSSCSESPDKDDDNWLSDVETIDEMDFETE